MDFEYRTCKKCHKLFKYVYGPELCENCRCEEEAEDAEFIKVRDYLYEHPRSSAMEISSKLKISSQKIFGWVREGKLSVLSNCKICGEPTTRGEICEKCKRLKKQL